MPQKLNRFRSLALELIALVILVTLAVFLYGKIRTQDTNDKERELKQSSVPVVENVPTTSPSPEPSPIFSAQPKVADITISIKAPNKNFVYKIAAEKKLTVYAAIQLAKKQGLQLKTKDFGGSLGILIEGINDIENNNKAQKYWTLYVNNVRSSVGASTAEVSPGDTITWKFENTTL